MLQVQTKAFDICQISKLLAKYKIKASITNQEITLEDEVSEELMDELLKVLTIKNIQNFPGTVFPVAQKELEPAKSDVVNPSFMKEKAAIGPTRVNVLLKPQMPEQYDLLYPTVKRGEVYICDFGKPYGSEQGKQRYAIVVQNDNGNLYAPTTIVLPCGTEPKKILPVHYHFFFSSENMVDYDVYRVGTKKNVILAEQIRTVDKTRLRKYIGTLTPEFMNKVQDIIDVTLSLQRNTNTTNMEEN